MPGDGAAVATVWNCELQLQLLTEALYPGSSCNRGTTAVRVTAPPTIDGSELELTDM
jgi:hypothetical protein